MPPDPTSTTSSQDQVRDDIDEKALAAAMQVVPLGAGAVSSIAVAMLVLGYLLIYVLVFVPRGVVG